MRGKYVIITVSAIICGTGAASWRAANEFGSRIQAANHLAAMAQLNAEEKARAAELALGVSEAAERYTREELALERKTRETAEQALNNVVNRTAQAARALTSQGNTKNPAQAEITREELVLTAAALDPAEKAIESKLDNVDAILHILDERIAKRVAACGLTQAELDNAKLKVLDLSLQLRQLRIEVEAKAQAPADRRPSEIKAPEVASDRRRTNRRPASNAVQTPAESSPLPRKRPAAVWYASQQNSSPN